MTDNEPTLTEDPSCRQPTCVERKPLWALSVVYCQEDPARVGEVVLVPSGCPGPVCIIGRGYGPRDPRRPRLEPCRRRPGELVPAPCWTSLRISRAQLELQALDDQWLDVKNVGKAGLWHNDTPVNTARVRPGDVLQIGQQLLFSCIRSPSWLASPAHTSVDFPYGLRDSTGLAGESAATWRLRERIAFVAARHEHVLITGPSGTGKEIVARAIHAHSNPRGRLVCRSAATLPAGIIDAELFGNARNYPNAGMPERGGLVGEAHGGVLYLDEFGELPAALHAHLLRVLDAGEYQRLGESRVRFSKFRLIAATNRPVEAIKEDLAARLKLRIDVPGLEERREDIVLLAYDLLRRIAADDPAAAARLFPNGNLAGAPRLSLRFVRQLVQHEYGTHVRELEAMLWDAMASSPGDELDTTFAKSPLRASAVDPPEHDAPEADPGRGGSTRAADGLDPEEIQRRLDQHHGIIELTWPVLGLKNRHALVRLIAKHALRAGRDWRSPLAFDPRDGAAHK